MELVFVYGPPAVGKLTVAKELASLTGYKVFHNHLTFDLALALFEPMSKAFFTLCDELRFRTFELSAQLGLEGMVFTFCYTHPLDDPFVERVGETVESAGGTVRFVQLSCEREELRRRVVAPDRGQFGKLSSPEGLDRALDCWDMDTPIPGSSTLRIDNTHTAPRQVAGQIIDHYGLPRLE